MAAVSQTQNTLADSQSDEPAVLALPSRVVPLAPAGDVPVSKVSDEVLFNLPISELQNYLDQADQYGKKQTARKMTDRIKKLESYLSAKDSPLAAYASTIAEQKHWQLILAISFAESGLGKHCPNNNCSGIGVAPGHQLWRAYPSFKEWIEDFNQLLDTRYQGWTLERMNGVYVQPKNPNWLLATKQVLEELQEQGIE
jgi:hypothetical protein